MSEAITLDMKCTKCSTTLARSMLFAIAIDSGGGAPDPCECPEGGDHDFVSPKEFERQRLARRAATSGSHRDLHKYLEVRRNAR